MDREAEMAVKVERVRALLAARSLGGVLLRERGNFAWLTGGGLSYVNEASEAGVGALLITPDRVHLIADNIEAERLLAEELDGLPIEVAEYPWHEKHLEARLVGQLADGAVGVDLGGGGEAVGEAITALRSPLTEPEIERYRELGRTATELTESVCRSIEPGMSEDAVAAEVKHVFERRGIRTPVHLVAADDRIVTRRHPINRGRTIRHRVMVVVCAERQGLWMNLTRLVNFEPIEDGLAERHRACCAVDATANAATRPGRTLGQVFAEIMAEYERQGFGDEWRLHHQGGSTGYSGRDVFATPASEAPVVADQAFAWNPSITGTKVEDTMLVREAGFEWLSEPGADWPVIEVERDGRPLRRADILVKAS